MSCERFIVGVSGRSGSGKSTLVQKILEYYGSDHVCLHTMDNYYLPRDQQYVDQNQYLNFDLPTSFYREQFYQDLLKLRSGESVEIKEYVFNNKVNRQSLMIHTAPVILVEGLFVFYYDEVQSLLDYKIMMDVSHQTCYERRLHRDTSERNYSETEVSYRYESHVEPSYQIYIAPFVKEADILINNEDSMQVGWTKVRALLDEKVLLKS